MAVSEYGLQESAPARKAWRSAGAMSYLGGYTKDDVRLTTDPMKVETLHDL
jgi:hypothetical protein